MTSLRSRIWTYPWDDWKSSPPFPWHAKFIPTLGEDERGYRTIVLPIPFVCQVVVAFRYCGCIFESDPVT